MSAVQARHFCAIWVESLFKRISSELVTSNIHDFSYLKVSASISRIFFMIKWVFFIFSTKQRFPQNCCFRWPSAESIRCCWHNLNGGSQMTSFKLFLLSLSHYTCLRLCFSYLCLHFWFCRRQWDFSWQALSPRGCHSLVSFIRTLDRVHSLAQGLNVSVSRLWDHVNICTFLWVHLRIVSEIQAQYTSLGAHILYPTRSIAWATNSNYFFLRRFK